MKVNVVIRLLLMSNILLLLPLTVTAQKECPTVKIDAIRLPDLNVARVNHATLFVNGELTVIGGHTNGFVPTATAEYFSDGAWHELPTVYPHDEGVAVVLQSGKVLLAGGHEQPLGIGQTFPTEWYDPVTHSFEGFGCLDTKRVIFSALELDSERVVISGNWYHKDGIELFDGHSQFMAVKDVAQQRCTPYIFRTARDNAVIFSPRDTVGRILDSVIVDRLRGEPFIPALFREWKPLPLHNFRPADSFIGDETKGTFAYLFPVSDQSGQVAVALLQGEDFSLLPTVGQIPMEHSGHSISWLTPFIADRMAKRAYMMGASADESHIYYIIGVDYSLSPARLTFGYTDPLPGVGISVPVLTADGNLVMVGGRLESGFQPNPSAVVFMLNDRENLLAVSFPWWWVVGVIVLVVILIVYKSYRPHRTKKSNEPNTLGEPSPDNGEMMERITLLMEQKKLFLNPDLKVADVAAELGTHGRTVSDCIKATHDCSFTQFINNYRVDYVKSLMADHPEKKIQELYIAAGFASETSFFRTFKQITGMTPREWISEQQS